MGAWGAESFQNADPLLVGSPKSSPSVPAFLLVSPPAPPVLPWALAGLGAELSQSASLSVPSSRETWYSSSRSIFLSFVIAPLECVDHW
jgi:hypothetical protein